MRSGMTIMSVVVAASLAGIVALAIGRLISGQAETMTAIKLREQREALLKHYKNIVVAGWDATRTRTGVGRCAGEICNRRGQIIIPYANGSALYLASDLYDYNYTGGTADRWWKVSVDKDDRLLSGSALQADSYVKRDPLVAVTVKVEFIRKEHPTVRTALADREEIVFLHHNTGSALGSNDTNCADGTHLTQRDQDGSALYHGTGAIVQYDFNSNYTKCSQVPLVNSEECTGSGALIGFFRKTSASPQLITGTPICSTKHHNTTPTDLAPAGIGNTEKRTVKAIDCSGSGYVRQIGSNEEPVCVPFSGGLPRRVAAESRAAEQATKEYTLQYRASDYSLQTATCTVSRDKPIVGFLASGEPSYLSTYPTPPTGVPGPGPQGPRGPWGAQGEMVGPRGPTGARGRCGQRYCCRYVTQTYRGRCGRWEGNRWVVRERNDCTRSVRRPCRG